MMKKERPVVTVTVPMYPHSYSLRKLNVPLSSRE